jgi:hypothetical protein
MTLHMQKFPASRQVPLTSEGKEFGFSPAVRPYQVENNAAAANVNEQLTGVHTEEKVAVNSQVAAYAVMQMIASGDLFAGGTPLPPPPSFFHSISSPGALQLINLGDGHYKLLQMET